MLEEVERDLGGAYTDTKVRKVRLARHFEDRPVVFVIAHADNALRPQPSQQFLEGVPFPGIRHVDLDHLATETAAKAGLVEQRLQDVKDLLTCDRGVSEVDSAARGLDLDPSSGRGAKQLGGLGIEYLESVQLLVPRRGKSTVPDDQSARDGDEIVELHVGATAENDHLPERRG